MITNRCDDRELLSTYARTVTASIDSEPGTLDDAAFERAQIAGLHAVLARYCTSTSQANEASSSPCSTSSSKIS